MRAARYGTHEAIKKEKHMMNFAAINSVPRVLSLLLLVPSMSTCLWLPPLTLDDQQFRIQPKAEIKDAPLVVADANIGKTHFIVGSEQAAAKKSAPPPAVQQALELDGIPLNCDGHVCTVLFDKFYDMLELLIEREQKRISIAAYMLTNRRIVQWLQEAKDRGVKIEVVTDLSCLRERSNKLGDLYEAGIPVFVCMPQRKGARSSLMHNKFVLFESNIYGRSIVWTGSANLTHSAFGEVHHENIVVLDDPTVYKEYERQFVQLKKHSERYEDCTITNAALHEKIRTSQNEQQKSTVMNGKNRRVA